MRFTSTVLSLLALGVSAATAQNTTTNGTVPGCALTCVFSTLPTSPCAPYGVSNLTCICESTAFQLAYYNCQTASCSATDLEAAENYGAAQCEANGTPINITATPSGASAAPSTLVTASGSSAAATSVPSSISAAVSSARSSIASAATSAGAAAPSARPAGAATKVGAGIAGMGAMVLGGVALLL